MKACPWSELLTGLQTALLAGIRSNQLFANGSAERDAMVLAEIALRYVYPAGLDTGQPVDQPNILAALIACDVMIRNLIHETEWKNDPAIKLVLSENTQCIQAASSKRESSYWQPSMGDVLEPFKRQAAKGYLNVPLTQAIALIIEAFTMPKEQGRRGSDND